MEPSEIIKLYTSFHLLIMNGLLDQWFNVFKAYCLPTYKTISRILTEMQQEGWDDEVK